MSDEKRVTGKDGELRKIPSVEKILNLPQIEKLLAKHPRGLVRESVQELLESSRKSLVEEETAAFDFDPDTFSQEVSKKIEGKLKPRLRRVINAAGVVLHTNLGRAPISRMAAERMREAVEGYCNLEYELETGKRGSREIHVGALLTRLTGAEAATVVNNNAAAVLLVLNTLARKKEVIVSRGELVEIGGSFRLPEVMARSGAKLVEVGTTNKTNPKDYADAITDKTALILKVHRSNFEMLGFVSDVPLAELVEIGEKHNIPVVEDLGSGAFIDLSRAGMKEPVTRESVKCGASLVTFSGDKLLGGPQAGVIVGKRELVAKLSRNPLTRALRVDKMRLSVLETTLLAYLDEEFAASEIPALRMIMLEPGKIERRAKTVMEKISGELPQGCEVELLKGKSEIGGGALPMLELPTVLVAINGKGAFLERTEEKLRLGEPPVIARIQDGKLLLDLRTVEEEMDELLSGLILLALRKARG
ncbi:MAG: L-seryl-tRNA(Sec) selenium transferase [Candidatus Eisenbacteria bacterium]|nr:L-seryl-tRNA(Sec) selenium transferase [Candidatus Eisenbacteria bacterium]